MNVKVSSQMFIQTYLRVKMNFRDTYSSTNLYQEWGERLMALVKSSTNFTSHTPKVREMERECIEAMYCDLHCN